MSRTCWPRSAPECWPASRPRDIRRAVANFKAVEHRLEYVATVSGVAYYNDSKATNVDATIKALESFPGRIHLILGGKDKGSDYTVLNPLLAERVKRVYTIGAAAAQNRIADQGCAGRQLGHHRQRGAPGQRLRAPTATSCCWLRPVPASTSSSATNIADASSKTWSANWRARRQLRQQRRRHRLMAMRVSVDKWLFTVILLLVFIGLVMVFSASAVMAQARFGSSYSFLLRQLGWAAAGIAAMVVVMNIDYQQYRRSSIVFTFLGFTTLVAGGRVSVFHDSHNTHRWIKLGPLSFQPSELAKPAIILYLAYFLESRWQQISDWKHVLLAGGRAQCAARGAHRQRA